MGRKKKEKAPEGAPEWMVTYGDMMTLLFCFFVIIVSMSEIKEEERFDKVLESIKMAFGYKGGVGKTPAEVPPNNTFDKQMLQLIVRKFQLQVGKSAEEGIEGENPSVKTIRDGLEFTLGGRVHFEPGKARLPDAAVKQIKEFAETIKGLNTKIRVKGHAASKPPEMYQPFASLDDLSYARAMEVKKLLVECGIRKQRITVEACGDNEPLETRAYDENSRAKNRRVSIIVTEDLVKDFEGESPDSGRETIF